MRQSGLEKERIGLRDIFEEIRYVGLEHYTGDLIARILDGTPVHYHKRNHTPKDSPLLHGYILPD